MNAEDLRAQVRINLLGREELLRIRRRRDLARQGALAATAGAVLAAAFIACHYGQLVQQRQSADADAKAVALLDPPAKEAAALKPLLLRLNQRLAALQALAQQRQVVAQSLIDVAQHLPPGVRLTQLQHEAESLVLTGTAASGERLARLLDAWSVPGRAWGRAELVSVAGVPVSPSSPSGPSLSPSISPPLLREAVNFSIRLQRQPPKELP